MASALYNNYKKLLFNGSVNPIQSGIYVMLTSGTYNTTATLTSNLANHTTTGDMAAFSEVGHANGYTRGGKQLQNKTASVVGTAGVFDADDLSWTSSTITASGAVIYQSGSNANNSFLIAWLDFGADQISSNGTFTISWNANGIINIA